jgi:hypothetical protein
MVPKILKRKLSRTADSENYSESTNAANISHIDESHEFSFEFQVSKHSLVLKDRMNGYFLRILFNEYSRPRL